jgi:hypothetical protein
MLPSIFSHDLLHEDLPELPVQEKQKRTVHICPCSVGCFYWFHNTTVLDLLKLLGVPKLPQKGDW